MLVSGIGPTVLLADAHGHPSRPGILCGVDTRSVAEGADLEERYGADDLLRRCGSRMFTQAAGGELEWLRRHEPDVLALACHFFTRTPTSRSG